MREGGRQKGGVEEPGTREKGKREEWKRQARVKGQEVTTKNIYLLILPHCRKGTKAKADGKMRRGKGETSFVL